MSQLKFIIYLFIFCISSMSSMVHGFDRPKIFSNERVSNIVKLSANYPDKYITFSCRNNTFIHVPINEIEKLSNNYSNNNGLNNDTDSYTLYVLSNKLLSRKSQILFTVNKIIPLNDTENKFGQLVLYFLENGKANVVDSNNRIIDKILIWYRAGKSSGSISAYFNIESKINDLEFLFFQTSWYREAAD